MCFKRFAAEDDGIVHNRFFAGLESSCQVFELLIDIREPFGDIGGLNLIRIDAVVHEHIEIGIVLPEQLAYADEGKVIILFCYKALRLIIHQLDQIEKPEIADTSDHMYDDVNVVKG